MVRTRSAIVIDEFNEPEPDVAIVAKENRYYARDHPTIDNTFLLIAVSDETTEYDLTERSLYYAAASIPEYWVVDLNRDLLVMHRSPSAGRYTEVQERKPDDAVAPQAFADIELTVREILLLDE